jgi:SAM-dependent methyltransferase
MHPDAYVEMAQTEDHHWWFTARREVLGTLIGRLALPERARILEIGCGTGGNLAMLSRFGQVAALEADAGARAMALRKSAGRHRILETRWPEESPFAGERFDLVCMFDVLEHIDDDRRALAALPGLLADGGRALVTVPAYRWLWSAHDEFLHHKRRYTARELERKAGAAGLRPALLTYFNTLLFPLAAVVRLVARDAPAGTTVPAAPLNAILRRIFGAERFLVGRLPLPFGVSLLAVLHAA